MKTYRFKKIIEIIARSFSNILNTKNGINLLKFNKNGKFDYDSYKKIQVEGNKAKIDEVFELEENIEMLSDFLKNNSSKMNFGICHGTRRGKEQEWFRKYLNIDVIGTEISDTATKFPNTIQWDFHNVKKEWLESIDFIYSNSLDHSYDPKFCLEQWLKCLKKDGFCIINGSTSHHPQLVNKLDPFGFTKDGLIHLINNLSDDNNIKIKKILNGKPNEKTHAKEWYYCIIQKI